MVELGQKKGTSVLGFIAGVHPGHRYWDSLPVSTLPMSLCESGNRDSRVEQSLRLLVQAVLVIPVQLVQAARE